MKIADAKILAASASDALTAGIDTNFTILPLICLKILLN